MHDATPNLTTETTADVTPQVACRLVGITLRQLDYWTRTRLVNIPDPTAITFLDLIRLRDTKKLVDTGLPLSEIRSRAQVNDTDVIPPLR